ncbi:hypothetical protein RFI_11178 [Reticulomyxa filosa]|uniref:Uncharacterized protein n=1 Tax=Reticulomyxa filosa TaxID=46433 RepID=X6NJR7_RETFI|nr:hypothetical protein RFI_11178 [Reticulomyxa filosa]|eukprot:ETO25959.1 hypothetical protein RFI_11178 [Reticulomyxa filosa]
MVTWLGAAAQDKDKDRKSEVVFEDKDSEKNVDSSEKEDLFVFFFFFTDESNETTSVWKDGKRRGREGTISERVIWAESLAINDNKDKDIIIITTTESEKEKIIKKKENEEKKEKESVNQQKEQAEELSANYAKRKQSQGEGSRSHEWSIENEEMHDPESTRMTSTSVRLNEIDHFVNINAQKEELESFHSPRETVVASKPHPLKLSYSNSQKVYSNGSNTNSLLNIEKQRQNAQASKSFSDLRAHRNGSNSRVAPKEKSSEVIEVHESPYQPQVIFFYVTVDFYFSGNSLMDGGISFLKKRKLPLRHQSMQDLTVPMTESANSEKRMTQSDILKGSNRLFLFSKEETGPISEQEGEDNDDDQVLEPAFFQKS